MKAGQEEYIKKFKSELATMMGRKQNIHRNCVPEGVTRSEFFALHQIRISMNENPEKKGIHVSDLAKRMNIALSAASRMLNSMEERGLICREIDPKSRRNICVSLTEEGEKLWKKCSESMSDLLERVIIGMGEEDASKLIELWKKFSELMEKEVDLDERKGFARKRASCGR
ncbi:MAG: MarR family transcriptional regulator [Hungatella sp.]|jgi:DNA-binding MarR family transcriptional regulator|nr:MarR family transcriptional regulator [Hungatella sp.]